MSSCLLTSGVLQNVCRRRQVVFDQLVAAYGTLEKRVVKLTREKEAQQTRVAELTGEPLADLACPALPGWKLFNTFVLVAAATSALPELEALRQKLGEAESQLKAHSDECDRLRKVEGELSETIKHLSASAATTKQEHEAELLRVLKVEEALQKERDDAVAGLEAAKVSHQKELLAAQGRANEAVEVMSAIDDLLNGKLPPAVADMVLFSLNPI